MYDELMSFADGAQPITLRRPGSDLEVSISKALIRRFRSRRYFRVQENVVPIKSAHWYLSQNLSETEPYEGDEIEDRFGDRWTILEVNRSELNETWQCVARKYAVRFGLDEHVDHLRPVFTKTPAGTLQQGYRVVKSGIAVKFSEKSRSVHETWKESLYVLTHVILETETGDALRTADGTIYIIRKHQNPFYRGGWTEIELVR